LRSTFLKQIITPREAKALLVSQTERYQNPVLQVKGKAKIFLHRYRRQTYRRESAALPRIQTPLAHDPHMLIDSGPSAEANHFVEDVEAG
jgi:hypothetical protein